MQEGSFEWYKQVFKDLLADDMTIFQNQKDSYDLLLNLNKDFPFRENKEVRDYAMKISQYTHKMADYVAGQTGSGKFNDLYYKLLLLEAPEIFESYLFYTEKNRSPGRRFYEPRKKTLNIVVQDLQDLEDGVIEFWVCLYHLGLVNLVCASFFCHGLWEKDRTAIMP